MGKTLQRDSGTSLLEILIVAGILGTLSSWVVGATQDMSDMTAANALDVQLARDARKAMARIRGDLGMTGIRMVDGLHYPHLYYNGVPGTARMAGSRQALDASEFISRGHSHVPAPIQGMIAYVDRLGLDRNDPLIQSSLILALPADQDANGRPDHDVLGYSISGPYGEWVGDGIPELDCNGDGVLSQEISDLVHPDLYLGLDGARLEVDEETRIAWSLNDIAWIVEPGPNGRNNLIRRIRDPRVPLGDPNYPFRREVIAEGVDWLDIKYAEDLQYWERQEDFDPADGGLGVVVAANALVVTMWMRGVDSRGRAHHYRAESILRLPFGDARFPDE
jgi:hypothetical protein